MSDIAKWKSILQSEPENCYICGFKACHKHHCIGGPCRKAAEKDGLYVRLCQPCHQSLHDHNEQEQRLKKLAQQTWMEHYGKSEEDWRARYIRSYL